MKSLRRLALLLTLLLLLAGALIGCAAEKPTNWVPIRGAAGTDAAPQTTAGERAIPQTQAATAPTTQPETAAPPTVETEAEVPVATEAEAPADTTAEPSAPTDTAPKPDTTTDTPAPPDAPADTPAPSDASERAVSAPETEPDTTAEQEPEVRYIANTNTKKFHEPTCSSVKDMKEENKWYFTGTRDELIEQGYQPCKRCDP